MKKLIKFTGIIAAILFVVSAFILIKYPNNNCTDVFLWIFLGSIALEVICGIELMVSPISQRNGKAKVIPLFLLVSAFSMNFNAQDVPEVDSWNNFGSESFSFDDNVKIYSEVYKVEDQRIQVKFTTFVGEQEEDNQLLIGLFEETGEENPKTLLERFLSFEELEKTLGNLEEEKSVSPRINENLKVYLLIKNSNFIMAMDFLDERGISEGYFAIYYPLKNLLQIRGGLDVGNSEINGYFPSGFSSNNCEVSRMEINSLN